MVDALRRGLDDAALVEQTMLVAIENTRSRFNAALGLHEPGLPRPLPDPLRRAREPPVSEDPFQRHRALLFTVAYDVLGSAAEAEDVVQDAWLRWRRASGTSPRRQGYLLRVITTWR